ncbi:Agenet-like domain-containing protein [Cynara cardunculus var. scolymus]|uniref:Agenet-like domain-containing protein n=1 Tax=Cynara cardunculus var. scolymus TaxID=59895 RepID=A0A103XRG1_CYNCS|nr:Agenet-like domain-containing protein [Cynara cardunculus var. scolymus]
MPMDYDDNDFHIQNLHLAGEGSSTVSPALRPYALPKFDYDDSLRGNLRFDSLVENEVFLGITGQEDNQWIEEYSRGSSGIEFSSSAAESRRNNVWSEATSSESVEMLLKSVGQEEGVVGETITDELDASDGPGCLATIMDPNLKQDDGKDHVIHAQKAMVPNKPQDNFSGFSASFDCEKSHITFTSQPQEAQISGGELDSVVLGKNCNFSEERVDRICGDVNQEAEKSAFELFKKESGDNLSTSEVECGDTGFTQNFSASKTGDLTKKSLSSETRSIKNKETGVDDPIGSDIAVETLTYSAEKPSVLSNVESLDKPSVEASIPVTESSSMHEDSLATPPVAGFVNVQATEDDNTKSEILATRESNVSSPSKVSDVQSRSVEETENDDVRDSQQATSDAFEVSMGSDPSEMCEGSSINNLGTNMTNECASAEFHAGSIINKDLVACSKTPKAQSGDLNKDKSLIAELSGSLQVNDEIQSSEQGGICMDEDLTFNEGGEVRLPSDSLDQKNVESTLSAEGCKKPSVMAQGSEDDMSILAEPGTAVQSDSVSSPDTPDGVQLLSGSIATDYMATKSPIHGVSSVHHDNEKKEEAGFFGDGTSGDESPKVASMIDCAAVEPLPVVEKSASTDRDGNVVHQMAGHCARPVDNNHAIMSEQTQEANPDGLGCSTTSVMSSLPFNSSAKVGDIGEAGGLQDPKESISGYHRAAPLSLAAEQQISTEVVPPSECDASHKRDNEDSSSSVDKTQYVSPSNTNNTELLQSTKVTHEMAEGAIYENASLLEVTEDLKGKMQSVSSNIDIRRDKSSTFEVTTTAALEQTGKGQQSFPAIQACNMSMNMEGSSINSSSSILDPQKPEEVRHAIPQNPVSATIQVGSKGNSERKTRRKSVGKESAKNSNRLKETTPRQSGRIEKSSVRLTSSATGHAIQFEELKPQEKIECSIKKPSGILPIPTSNLPDLNNSTAIFKQPFTDNQQVQLRAQILVYGSLISGSPPEEAHMIAAFGQSDGGRETWEGAWHACVERVHGKKSQANNPSTLMQSRSDLKDVGHRTPDPGIKHSSFPSKVLSSPLGGASNKGTPSVISPLIPLSSPLWNISTPSSVGFPSSSMTRSALHDYRQSFSPLHPYQAPPVQNSSGHNPPWLSQGPFAGQWVASSPVSAFNAGARFSALPITEAVKLTPAKVSGGPGIKHTYSIPVVHSAGPSVFSGASSLSDAKKTTASSGQASSDSKSRKRKKNTATVADQTSVPRQALLASVTAPPVALLHQVTHSEGYNRAPLLAENQTVSITAPVVSSIFSTSVTVSTPASIKSKSSPGRFLSVLSTHEHPRFRDKKVENVGISEQTLNKVEKCKLQAEDAGVHAAAAAKTCQSSTDSKTLKKKKMTTSLDVNQASVPRQAPVASITGPVIGYLPHLFRTEDHSQILLLAPNQTDSVTAPVVCSPFPMSVAMSTPLPITSKSSPGRFTKVVYPASTLGYPKPGYQNMEKAVAAEETLSKVKESKLQAENAALLAAAEVSHCQGVWSRLEKQRRSGVVSDDEVNLMSSTVSVAAATIAKMAAAAAKIASDVAEQARLMADEVFLSRKAENLDQSSIISHPKDTPASSLKSMDKSNHPNSIISAAREAARRRIQAASAASKHAENLDAIVKAAELAAEAVSQAGKIVAMGDLSDLRKLVEAGPEGYLKTSQLAHDQQGEVSGHLNSITDRQKVEAAPNMCTKEIHTLKRGLVLQEPSVYLAENEMMVIDDLSGSITGNERDTRIPRAHKGPNLSKAAGVAPETDTGSLHADVYKDDDKYKGAWLMAKVLSLKDEKALLCYSEIQSSDEGSEKLKEWVPPEVEIEGNKVPRVRIARSMTTMGYEGTRKRRRTAVTDYSWSSGDRVDVWMQDCWREGVVMEPNKIDLTSIAVQFPALGETLVVRSWHIRPTLVWKDKKWIEWSSLKGGCASEGETPKEKRMKLASPVKDKGKDKSPKIVDLVESGRHEELGTLPLSAQESSFNVGKSTRDENNLRKMRSGLQKEGARVIFGVPKPGKKQKFMDVSKHYVADGSKKNNTANDPIKFARYLKPQAPGAHGWKLNSRNDARETQVAETKSRLKSRKPPVPSFRTLTQKDNNPKSTTRDSEMTDKSDSDVEKQKEFVSSSNTKGPALDVPKKDFSFTSIPKSEHLNKGKLVPAEGKTAKVEVKEKSIPEVIEPRRSNRRIQPTSRLLEGLQSSLTISKIPSVSHASQRSHNKGIPAMMGDRMEMILASSRQVGDVGLRLQEDCLTI